MWRRVLALWSTAQAKRKRVGIHVAYVKTSLKVSFRRPLQKVCSIVFRPRLQRYTPLLQGIAFSFGNTFAVSRFPFIYKLIPWLRHGKSPQATLHSLNGQLYRQFSVTLLDVGGTMGPGGRFRPLGDWEFLLEYVEETDVVYFLFRLNESLVTEWAKDYLMVVPAGDGLSEHAFYWVAAELQDHPRPP
jgi:hypothetical protein